MSLYDYKVSKVIDAEQYPFASLIMAAMRRADTLNLGKLRLAFPELWNELEARYNAPGGEIMVCPNCGKPKSQWMCLSCNYLEERPVRDLETGETVDEEIARLRRGESET